MNQQKPKVALEKLIKENFCHLISVQGCGYSNESWCEKTCGLYKKPDQQKKEGKESYQDYII